VNGCSGGRCTIAYPEEWESPVTLVFDGGRWTGRGTLKRDTWWTCFGKPIPSRFTITLEVASAGFDGTRSVARTLRGTQIEQMDETAECPGTDAPGYAWTLTDQTSG
jgi:hypothetical protein